MTKLRQRKLDRVGAVRALEQERKAGPIDGLGPRNRKERRALASAIEKRAKMIKP